MQSRLMQCGSFQYLYYVPFLLWKAQFPTSLRLILFAGVELCWNMYPSNSYSSFLLLCIHLFIDCGVFGLPHLKVNSLMKNPQGKRRNDCNG
ncbi:unnamed protein product [Musa acuminata subsp. malaccensis]|uniref:dolichyl-P-Man:Man5GlcNAc2-PP-dolichol alpha-1,3-mannosyltransferase n=1 Tax=Musa acuminata subsp. malaccensis TaxID=214687 RepID=A0A804HMQ3_MUSAM|nr:unnamed protein product [Musa acuminata subsp. malaccensis]